MLKIRELVYDLGLKILRSTCGFEGYNRMILPGCSTYSVNFGDSSSYVVDVYEGHTLVYTTGKCADRYKRGIELLHKLVW